MYPRRWTVMSNVCRMSLHRLTNGSYYARHKDLSVYCLREPPTVCSRRPSRALFRGKTRRDRLQDWPQRSAEELNQQPLGRLTSLFVVTT